LSSDNRASILHVTVPDDSQTETVRIYLSDKSWTKAFYYWATNDQVLSSFFYLFVSKPRRL